MAGAEIVATGSWLRCDYDLATHEAAHAVTAVLFGLDLEYARIDAAEAEWDGLVMSKPIWTREAIHDEIRSTLAGWLAENGSEIRWPPDRSVLGDEGICGYLVWVGLIQGGRVALPGPLDERAAGAP